MGRLKKGLIGVALISALPVAAAAQTPTAVISQPGDPNAPASVGGIPSVDFITLGPMGPGAPLRFGNVLTNSEVVQLEGTTLKQGSDYFMDYAVGVVYLKIAQRAGQVLTVSYRYKAGQAAAAPGTSSLAALTQFKYTISPGAMQFLTGVGLTERGSDGSIMQNNLFGLNNSFKLSQSSSLSGLFIVGERERSQNTGGLNMDMGASGGSNSYRSGKEQLIVQSLNSSILGGSAKLDYQDISRNFNGLNSLAGVDPATANRLQAERGIKRTGFSLDDMKLGNTLMSTSYRDVRQDESGIFWRGYGIKNGGFGLNFSSQQVDSNFNRFGDLSESSKAQLAAEAGMRRQNVNGGWATEFGKLSYASGKISDDSTHTNINHSEYALNTSKLRFDMGNERVDSGFMRFNSLMAPEQAAFGREAGVKRDWMAAQSNLLGRTVPVNFSQTTLTSANTTFKGQDAAIGSRTWSLEHIDRNISQGFMSIGAMSDPEIDSNVKSIANMYGSDVHPGGNDRAEFLTNSGIDRKYDGFSTDALKGWKLIGSNLDLKGRSDKGKVDSFAASSKNVLLFVRKESLGTRFSEINEMMDFEKMRLSTLPGLNRTDMGATVFEGRSRMDANSLSLSTSTGSVDRKTFAFDDPNRINVQVGERNVSKNFQDGAALSDPESMLLQSLAGFHEADAKVKWNLAPGSTLDSFAEQQYNPSNRQTWSTHNTVLDYRLDKTTAFNYTDTEQHDNAPLSTIFSSVVSKMSLTKDFGRYGLIKVLDENDSYTGPNATGLDQHHDYLGYQAKLTSATTFKTEQSFTTYDHGQKENINANTISTSLTKNTGVSLTDTEVSRTGSPDESHRNYGFWYDLGNGVKLSYGYARDILPNGVANETSQGLTIGKTPVGQSTVQPGQAGNLLIGGAYYQNQWDVNDRAQTNGNISAANVKPLTLGPIQDIKFNLNFDSGGDYSKTLHEYKMGNVQGRFGTYQFGLEYKGQMDPTGNRAIDRTIKLITDPSEKKLISAGISYKDRTMPDNSTIIIRDFNITLRPKKNLTITNLLQTNPDIANPGALLGSVPQASRSDKWTADYKLNPNLTYGGLFQELINDQDHSSSQTGGFTMKLFEKSGSPITIFYGLESADRSDLWRKTQRYSIQFDQKPGPNQTISLFIANLSYEHSVPVGSYSNSNTLRINYQYRF